MVKNKRVGGIDGGHRSKKDFQLLIVKAGRVVHEVKPITTTTQP